MQWFRFYHDILEDREIMGLPDDLYRCWTYALVLASRNRERGTLPSVEDAAFLMRLTEEEARRRLDALREKGLLVETDGGRLAPRDWSERQFESDSGAERQRAYRERQKARTQAHTHRDAGSDVTRDVTPSVSESGSSSALSSGSASRSAPQTRIASGLSPEDWRRFREFFTSYPKKKGERDEERAEQWWAQHRPDDATLDEMLDALEREGDARRERYYRGERDISIPPPHVWLADRPWEDRGASFD